MCLEQIQKKAGVSLVTVLLFMLVATIAATATYKWLTSEGHSSASRMMKREAYQSSIAGIENARAWMTFHANETGALIKQYIYDADGKPKTTKTPINIDAQLQQFAQGSLQDHHVWLVGVNTEDPTYKVKILSEGVSRNGRARHTEVAIFNVDGLYRVNKPKEREEFTPNIDFKFNYFGGSTTTGGSLGAYSILVNGNLLGANPVYSETDLIVTGDLIMSASGVGADGTACIGGTFDGNNGAYGTDFYIGGNASNFSWPTCPEGWNTYNNPSVNQTSCPNPTAFRSVTGNVYINGNLNAADKGAGDNGGQKFPQNLTLNGTWYANLSSKQAAVDGDLCVGEHGMVLVNTNNSSRTFAVDGNVWMPGDTSIWLGSVQEYGCTCDENVYSSDMMGGWILSSTNNGVPCHDDWYDWSYPAKRHAYINKSCAGMKLVGVGDQGIDDNYDKYDKIHLGKKKDSKVYIKSARKHKDYDDLYKDRIFTTKGDQVRNCKANDCLGDGNRTMWNDNEELETYLPKEAKPGLHYIYLGLPDGVTRDVDYGMYHDSRWDRDIHGFFVNILGNTKDETTRFTDSYDLYMTCYDKPNQPYLSSYKCYRTLNYENINGKYKITGSPYCYAKTSGTNAKQYVPRCGVAPWFKSDGEVKNTFPSPQPFNCAENVKTTCLEKLGSPTTGCDGSSYKVNDLLTTAYSTFSGYANLGCDVTSFYEKDVAKGINEWSHDLNSCYDNNSPENLYNGYQVISISNVATKTSDEPLDGDFIIIVTASSGELLKLPPTEEDAHVLVYFPNGYNNSIGPSCTPDRRASGECSGSTYNYFIYTAGDIKEFLFNRDVFHGSVYGKVGENTCAKVEKFQSSKMEFNEPLLQHLEEKHVLCKSSPCGTAEGEGEGGSGGSGSGSGSGSSEYETGSMDVNFISNAPQLGVTLESQYETSEPVPTGNNIPNLDPSFIVLPRIIFLNKDPAGKLTDYFNIIPLNGANVDKSTATVACIPSLNVTSDLVSGGSKLDERIYRCAASALSKRDSFWVWVEGARSSDPQISFVEPTKKLVPGEPYEVKINLPAHSAALDVKIDATSFPSDWTVSYGTAAVNPSSSPYTFHFNVDASDATPTLFTVTPPSNAENGSITFTIQPGEGYQRYNPSTTNLLIASSVTLTNSFAVTVTDINAWCASHSSVCPSSSLRGSWPDCPDMESVEWVVPDWGQFTTEPGSENKSWSILTSNTGTLKLKEKVGSNCVVIIPETSNSYSAPIVSEPSEPYTLRAIAKAKSHTLKLQFVGDVGDDKPFVYYKPGNRPEEPCYYENNSNHNCSITVFDGESVQLRIDKEDTGGENKEFNYWLCSGVSCPVTDPVSSVAFNEFQVSDDDTEVGIHFGEKDKHCFFDEFRKTLAANKTHSCAYSGEEENVYCIGTGANAKWKMAKSDEINYVEKEPYQGYVVAAKGAPSGGVKVMSTVQAGIHGHLRALFQLPHATASYDEKSSKIKNSGFLLRANSAGTQFFMLNVYANASGKLEAQLCLDGGDRCLDPVELKRNYSPAYVSPSSMVMLFATFDDASTLKLKAFTGNYYNTEAIKDEAYTAELNLSGLGTSRADLTYQYVGFSLASRDFKVYGIGWESIDYAQECFDGPPAVRCSFAAVAQNGIIPTYGSLTGQSTEYQKPWVGHSGWYDSKDCTPAYSYETNETSDAVVSAAEGYQFSQSGAGAHGYKDAESGEDVKTAYAALNGCSAAGTETQAWASTTPAAHCGPFWTGKLTECKKDTPLLPADFPVEGRTVLSGETYPLTFAAKNLRGVEKVGDFGGLIITLLKTDDDDADMEVWLESKSTSWGGVNYESRHVRINGKQRQITQTFDVDSDFGDNATGFDPENVVAIKFKNNGDYSVTVKSIKAECKNAVKFNGCSLSSEGSSWKIEIDAGANSNKITSVSVSGTPGQLSKTADCPNCFEIIVPDANFYKNAGTEYEFSATVNVTGDDPKTKTCTCASNSCAPTAITCTPTAITGQKKGGDSWPNFKFTLAGCPAEGCEYSVYLSSDQSSFASNDLAANGEHNHQHTGTIPECETQGGCSYTYEVKSDNAAKPFGECKTTFTVQQKGKEDLTLSCGLISLSGQTVGSDALTTSGSVSATSGCGTGETCTWSITQGGSTVGGGSSATFPNSPYSFSGSDEAGTYSYVFTVTRASDGASDTCMFEASYPLNLSCGNDYSNPGATTPIPVGDPVTLPTVSGTNSGCNGKCTYTITGGGLSNVGGNYTDNMTFSTFSDQNATGTGSSFNVNYALNIYKGGSQPVLSCSPLTVTYAGTVEPTPTCAEITWNISGDNGTLQNKTLTNGCATIKTNSVCKNEVQIKFDDCKGKSGKWNGVDFTFDTGTPAYYRFAPNPVLRTTNALEVSDCSKINTIYVSGCSQVGAATDVPAITCPSSSTASPIKRPTESNLNIAVSNCMVEGGCSYTLTKDGSSIGSAQTYYGNSISIPGETTATGPYTYVLSVSNSQSGGTPSTCEVHVTYETVTVVTLETDETGDVTCGENVKTNISCSNTCSKLQCSGGYDTIKMKRKSNGEEKTGGRHYMPPFTVNGNGGPSTLIDEFTTECEGGSGKLSCSASCGC